VKGSISKVFEALHNDDTSLKGILKHFSPFDFNSVPSEQKAISLYSEKSKELSIAADPKGKYGEQGTLELEE